MLLGSITKCGVKMAKYYAVILLGKMRQIDDDVAALGVTERPQMLYKSERAAKAAAEALAQQHPKSQVAIFMSTSTVETKTPTFIEKVFTDNGELIPK